MTKKNNYTLDTFALARAVKQKRGERGLREIADEIGEVSPSTLSRMEREELDSLNTNTLFRVCGWLNVHPATFIEPYADKNDIQQAQAQIARRKLEEAHRAIENMLLLF